MTLYHIGEQSSPEQYLSLLLPASSSSSCVQAVQLYGGALNPVKLLEWCGSSCPLLRSLEAQGHMKCTEPPPALGWPWDDEEVEHKEEEHIPHVAALPAGPQLPHLLILHVHGTQFNTHNTVPFRLFDALAALLPLHTPRLLYCSFTAHFNHRGLAVQPHRLLPLSRLPQLRGFRVSGAEWAFDGRYQLCLHAQDSGDFQPPLPPLPRHPELHGRLQSRLAQCGVVVTEGEAEHGEQRRYGIAGGALSCRAFVEKLERNGAHCTGRQACFAELQDCVSTPATHEQQ